MKILHVISSVNPKGGGPIEGVTQLSALAMTKGHHVEICCLDTPDARYLTSSETITHALGPTTTKYAFTNRLVPWLTENAKQFDIVIVNGIWQYHSFGVWRALRKSSTPYVLFTHGMLDPWFKRTYPLKHLKKWAYWPWGEYRVLRDAAAVLFTCEEEKLSARRSFWLYKANEVVVNYGTAAPPGDQEIQRCIFHEHFPETRGKRLITFLGRIHPKKGCDLAIRAFAEVLSRDHNWHLVVAGPDQIGWRVELQKIAQRLGMSRRITWTGMVTGNLKWGMLRSAEAFFLPSHQENFGIAVAEALACGVPVLISNKINIWREIDSEKAGLIATDDLEGARSLLRNWLSLTEEEKISMRRNAQACFEQKFDIQQASRSLLAVLQGVAKVRPVTKPSAKAMQGSGVSSQ